MHAAFASCEASAPIIQRRQYFVEYRRKMRGSAKRPARRRGCGRRTTRKAVEVDEPWEEGTSDEESEARENDDLKLSSSQRQQQPRRCRADARGFGDNAVELLPEQVRRAFS
jgi:hypothetical protein